MPRLDFYADLKPFLSVRLEVQEFLIGRAPDCAVQLTGPNVSRQIILQVTAANAAY